jgi:hypothetical protein
VAERKKRWCIRRWHFTTVAVAIKDFSDGGRELKVEDGNNRKNQMWDKMWTK